MRKRRLGIALTLGAGLSLAVLLMTRRHSPAEIPTFPGAVKITAQRIEKIEGIQSEPGRLAEKNPALARILKLANEKNTPAQMAALLGHLYAENPDGLFEALMTVGKASLETRRKILPLLADALVLWPEAEGRYVFRVADSYAEMDLSAAAEWGATFLIQTNRSDMAVSSLLGRLSGISENRALELIPFLPERARRDALNSAAYHIQIGDLDHLIQVCRILDPQGVSTFSKQLFERVAAERLDESARWLATMPEAARLPGAVSSISQALVSNRGPQKAILWADSLLDANAEAQAVTTIYRAWARLSPESAIKDSLPAFDGIPELTADSFKGATEHHGSGAVTQWDAACQLNNSSARSYAISALIEPMLVTIGPIETKAKVALLPAASLERNVAELMIQEAYENPATARFLENRFGKTE